MPPRPIDPILVNPRDEPLTCLQINEAWIPFLLGIVRPYQYPEQWRGTLEENRQMRQFAKVLMDILTEALGCDDMTTCCYVTEQTTVILRRMNPVTYQLEVSADNGTTWTPDPQALENLIVALPPPVPAGVSANKCDAATNGLEHIKDEVLGISSNLTNVGTLAEFIMTVIGLILLALATASSGGTLTPAFVTMWGIIAAAAKGVYEAGKTHFDDFWTEANYDKVLCCLYCNIGDDGTFTQDQFVAFINQWYRDLGRDYPSDIIISGIKSAGRRGLNQLCAYGQAADADCNGCDCPTCATAWALSYPDNPIFGTLTNNPDGTITVASDQVNSNNAYYIDIRTPSEANCCYYIGFEQTSGDNAVSIYHQSCGVAFAIDNFDGQSFCMHHMQLISPTPFSGILTFDECPA